jgi:hypothetical protein
MARPPLLAITGDTFASSPFLQSRLSMRPFTEPGSLRQRFSPQVVFSSEMRGNCIPQTIFFTEVSETESSEVLSLSLTEAMTRLIRMNPWSCYDKNTAGAHLAIHGSEETFKAKKGATPHAGGSHAAQLLSR